jgi:hypothetical protein
MKKLLLLLTVSVLGVLWSEVEMFGQTEVPRASARRVDSSSKESGGKSGETIRGFGHTR